jgi:hypothetical protein
MERLGARDLPSVMFLLRGFMVPMGMTLLVLMEGLSKKIRQIKRAQRVGRASMQEPYFAFQYIYSF